MPSPLLNAAEGVTLSVIARMKLTAELASLVKKKISMPAMGPVAAIQGAKVSKEIVQILQKLGAKMPAPGAHAKATALEGGPEPIETPRKPTGHFFDHNPLRKTSERRKDNSAAMALLKQIRAGEADALTDAQKALLARYSGTGGNLIAADGKKGSAYEYYTPKPIAEGMWILLREMGFSGGKVLDPSSGTGIFGATAPASAAIDSVELDETSGAINALVNAGPGYNAITSPFEAVASRTSDEVYDAVITNVPFGSVHDRGANRKLDPLYQDEPLEAYFILRTLRKLKPGGLAAFIVPPRVVSARGGREEKLRVAVSYMAEFRGGYRLPNSVFGAADADTITDVIVFRKYSREALTKIEELKEQAPEVLVQAGVQWQDFITGNYFKGPGRKFVLGEFQARDPNKFRDVDRVISTHSVADIAKMLRKLPASHVNWELINATETAPIIYADGDTMTLAGQTLQMRDGVWVAIGRASEASRFDELGQLVTDPVVALSNRLTWNQANDFCAHLEAQSLGLDIPDWLRRVRDDLTRLPESDRAKYWAALLAGCSAVQVTQQHGSEAGFNYAEEYPQVGQALIEASVTAGKRPAAFSADSKAALIKVGILYDRRAGFSPLWSGQILKTVGDATLSEEDQVRALKYKTKSIVLDVAALKAVYGEHFDPLEDDDWCVNHDGTKASRADDYYVGNLGDFLARIDGHIAQASGPLRDKLLRQKQAASERVVGLEPADVRFNLFTPFVTLEEKAEFLRRFVHPAYVVGHDANGEREIICDIKSPKSEQERQYKRFAEYLRTGNLSTRTTADEASNNPLLEERRRKGLRDMASTANAQFDQWVHANAVIMERLRAQASDPARLYFREVEDSTPVHIEGMAEGLALHGYQNAEVRRQGRSFGGINGFDVGLGKTVSALAATQYVHNIGVKKKTVFVVPNSVLSNWRREAGRAYASTDECLFVGLNVDVKTGDASVDSANYARDLHIVLENRHSKIFCTLEAFKMIPLKPETIDAYEDYLMAVDPSYAGGDRRAESERAESKVAEATTGTGAKSAAMPYFEDMGIDSIVIDEAHMFKNSKNTVEFSGAKFLSVAEASQRGLDVQMKAWYVRGQSELHDGVMLLTATPITNSPLEIYSMLSLSVGEKRVHDLVMGAKGADEFMQVMCDIQDDEEVSIDGRTRNYRVFRGLQNVNLLRNALGTAANIKTGEDVKANGDDLRLPDAPENRTAVQLTDEMSGILEQYKMAYRAARFVTGAAGKNADEPTPEEMAALDDVSAKFGEPHELIAHPFNLINKMTMVIADKELDERATFYDFSPAQREQADKAIAAFNKLDKVEVRRLPGPWTRDDAVVGAKTVKDGETEIKMVRIRVEAAVTKDGRIVVDTLDTNTQGDFEKAAAKAGLELDCTVPPKLAALLDNVRKEEAHPRSVSGRVKQIIFCDILPLHNKIKRLLVKHAGFSTSSIAFISGQSIKNPEQLQDIQDGFNAEGEDNRYRIIIANEKAEVGINLQKGTQAIHHLSIGWTPDSQVQRNGRGVRQGNTTGVVNIYHYDADGTFDTYKRTLTNKKANWIGAVMDKRGANDVAVSGGLTNDQLDELIQSMGDDAAVQAIRDRAAMREKLARAETARARQVINLRTAQAQKEFQAKFDTSKKWVVAKAMALYDMRKSLESLEARARNPGKMAPATLIKLQDRVAEMRAKVEGLTRDLDQSAIFKNSYRSGEPVFKSVVEALDQSTHYSAAAKVREAIEKRVTYGVEVRDGSTLDLDWQSEVAAAERMVQEAKKDFERIAAGPDNGLPTKLLEALDRDEVRVLDGRVLAAGMFLRAPDDTLYVLESPTWYTRFPAAGGYVADAVGKGWEIIMFGTAEYEQALNDAAAFDDAQESVTSTQAGKLFSSIVPEVAQRRTKQTLVRYSGHSIKLPSPQFPYPIDTAKDISEGAKKIAATQTAIASWDDDYALIDSAVKVVNEYQRPDAVVKELAAWARAHHTPLTFSDYMLIGFGSLASYNEGACRTYLNSAGAWSQDMRAQLELASSESDLNSAARKILEAVMGAYLVLPPGEGFDGFAPLWLQNAFNARAAAIKRNDELAAMAKQALEAAEAGKASAEAAVAASAVEPAPLDDLAGAVPNARGLIGISGDTRPHKEMIKEAAKKVGGYARWNNAATVWEVPEKTWAFIKLNHAEAAKVLQPVSI
jgi:hypothetical protein